MSDGHMAMYTLVGLISLYMYDDRIEELAAVIRSRNRTCKKKWLVRPAYNVKTMYVDNNNCSE